MLFRDTLGSASTSPLNLVQESAGFNLNIDENLEQVAINAAQLTKQRYDAWKNGGYREESTAFKRQYFAIAVGGGNTLKAQYKALLLYYCWTIDWAEEVRFFFLEESSGEAGWESSRDSLVNNFIHPLATALIARHGPRRLCRMLDLVNTADNGDIIDQLVARMIHPIGVAEISAALGENKKVLAKKLARQESARYQRLLKKKLGAGMGCHLILSGIGKDGSIGAFTPNTPQLKDRKPAVTVLDGPDGALRIALGRGVLIAADCISLIISGNLKLNALGRFEMEESVGFEQTVRETPIRMLRETPDIAAKVHIFADQRALHFEESVFTFQDDGKPVEIRAEVRDGLEENGIHMLLLHGFMGLFSFITLLIRLPSSWRTSALHRGRLAKTLKPDRIFPHYANALRKIMLRNWLKGRPVPVGFHSIAGIISDHLLLSFAGTNGKLPAYEQLSKPNQQLIDALRASGMVHLATWAPSDVTHHINVNTRNLKNHYIKGTPLDYSVTRDFYQRDTHGRLRLHPDLPISSKSEVASMEKLLKLSWTETLINSMNGLLRQLLSRREVQKKILNRDLPYALRIIGGRLLRKISYYGLIKEISASLHNPIQYQRRHVRALEAIIEYDIPYLSIIHQDDFLVSANRHREEYEYLRDRRLEKEGVTAVKDLSVVTRFVLLQRETEELPMDPLNPHLLVMSTTDEGNRLIRNITGEMTRFVKENVKRAIEAGQVAPIESVTGKSENTSRAASA